MEKGGGTAVLDVRAFERLRARTRLAALALQAVLCLGAAYVTAQMPDMSAVQSVVFLGNALLCLGLLPVLLRAERRGDRRTAELIGNIIVAMGALIVLQRVAYAYHGPLLGDPILSVFRPVVVFVPFVQVAAITVLRGHNALRLCIVYWLALCVVIISGLWGRVDLIADRAGLVLVLLWLFAANPLFLLMLYALPRSEDLMRASERELRAAREQAVLLRQLGESETRFRAFMNNSPAIAWLKDESGRYLFANSAFEQHFGIARDAWASKTDFELLPGEFARGCRAAELQVIAERKAISVAGPAPDASGADREWLLLRFPVEQSSGEIYIGGVATDITERRRLERALEASEAQVRGLMDGSPVLVWMKDAAGRYSYMSRSFEQRFRLRAEQLIGKTDADWCPPELAEAYAQSDSEVLQSGRTKETVEASTDPDGGLRHWWVFKFPFQNALGQRFVGGVAVDMTERKRAEDLVKLQSMTDELTGTYNRRGFFLLAEQELRSMRRTLQTASVLFVDIDGLKSVNDRYGHASGDEAIIAVAEALRLSVRDCDIIGRLGGDEFGVLALNCSSTADMEERIRQYIADFNTHCTNPWRLSVTVGTLPVAPDQAGSFEELIAGADAQMYLRKAQRHSET